uniref:Uncharacterized protein n=1 Tax=Neolamprologus brichardi TaxID=32507 RepID=A0A3Q4GTM3_NEOBR
LTNQILKGHDELLTELLDPQNFIDNNCGPLYYTMKSVITQLNDTVDHYNITLISEPAGREMYDEKILILKNRLVS